MTSESRILVVRVTPFAVSEVGEGNNRRVIVEWHETVYGEPKTRIATCHLQHSNLWATLKAARNCPCFLDLLGRTIVGVSGVGLPMVG